MKSESQVRQKLKQARYRHKADHLQKVLSRRHYNCTHNREVPMVQGGVVFVCTNVDLEPPRRGDLVCDHTHHGPSRGIRAQNCPLFTASVNKEGAIGEFEAAVTGTPVQVAEAGYPALAALMWVLDGDIGPLDLYLDGTAHEAEGAAQELVVGTTQEIADIYLPKPWYRRLMWWR